MAEALQIGGFHVFEQTMPLITDIDTPEGIRLKPDAHCYDVHLIDSLYEEHPEIRLNLRYAWRRSLEELAFYVQQRKNSYDAEVIIGTTYPKLGRIAVRGFGFHAVPSESNTALEPERTQLLAERFHANPMIVWMMINDLIDRFSVGWGTEHVKKTAHGRLLTTKSLST